MMYNVELLGIEGRMHNVEFFGIVYIGRMHDAELLRIVYMGRTHEVSIELLGVV